MICCSFFVPELRKHLKSAEKCKEFLLLASIILAGLHLNLSPLTVYEIDKLNVLSVEVSLIFLHLFISGKSIIVPSAIYVVLGRDSVLIFFIV